MRGRQIAAQAALVLLLAACGGESDAPATEPHTPTTSEAVLPVIEEPPPTARQLIGTWSRIGVAAQIRLRAEGTFAIDRTNVDSGSPYAAGIYAFDGDLIRFTGRGLACPDTWTWKVGIDQGADPLDDELHIVFVEAGCGVVAGASWRLARISTS